MEWRVHTDDESIRINLTIFKSFLKGPSRLRVWMAWLLGEDDGVWEVL